MEGKVVSAFVKAQFGEVVLCYRSEMTGMPYDLRHRG